MQKKNHIFSTFAMAAGVLLSAGCSQGLEVKPLETSTPVAAAEQGAKEESVPDNKSTGAEESATEVPATPVQAATEPEPASPVEATSTQPGEDSQKTETAEPTVDASKESVEIANDVNGFALNFYRQSAQENSDGNVVVCPRGTLTLLAALAQGAAGDTGREIEELIKMSTGDERFAKLAQSLSASEGSNELTVCNGVWTGEKTELLPEYKQWLREQLSVTCDQVDFEKNATATRDRINDWAREKTNGQIDSLFDVLLPNTRLILANAICFKAKWEKSFDKSLTEEDYFTSLTQGDVATSLMRQYERFAWSKTDSFQWLRLPYGGDAYSMEVILPEEGTGSQESLARVESELTPEMLAEVVAKAEMRDVDLRLPRIQLSYAVSLNDILQKMGMDLAFGMEADFSRMTSQKDIFVSDVLQKISLEMDEEGTVAASASAAALTTKAATTEDRVRFHATHPFLFLIRENQSGTILLIGRFGQPDAISVESTLIGIGGAIE
ncbi:MAG: serpin family protein [Planctomycetia bacterium]|nr:serpin family protein [Planctomycetia bacterium]